MFPHDRKNFRYRFIRVMALIFLLNSPTRASSGPKDCAAVQKSWMAAGPTLTDKMSLFLDPKFIGNLVNCTKQVWEAGGKITAELKPIIKQLPEVIKKVLPDGTKGGLVVLSVYVLYRSFELLERVQHLKIDYEMHDEQFKVLKADVKQYQDYIVTNLIPEWEKGNTGNMQKKTDELLEMIRRLWKEVEELIQSIYRDTQKAQSDILWSLFYPFVAVAACVGSIAGRNFQVSLFVCGVGIPTIGISIKSYTLSSNTRAELDRLRKDVHNTRKEIRTYYTQLNITKISGELYI